MFGRGGRSAMGGMRGDAFVFYHGMEAGQEKGIQALFNDAEVNTSFSINLNSNFKIGFYGAP